MPSLSHPVSDRLWWGAGLVAGTALFVGLCHTIWNFDIFWHLATGRAIVTTGEIPHTDIFSYTAAGAPWTNVQWGFDVLTFHLMEVGGYAALTVLRMGVLGAAFLVVFGHCRSVAPTRVALPLVLLAFLAAEERFVVRPEMGTYLWVAVYGVVLAKYRQTRRRRTRKR